MALQQARSELDAPGSMIAPPSGAARPGPATRVAVAAAVVAPLFVFVLSVYRLGGDFLPARDAAFSTYLPALLLSRGTFGVTPTSAPAMFTWGLRTPNGVELESFAGWSEHLGGRSAEELRCGGELNLVGPKYYLAPSVRRDRRTGEVVYVNTFGPGTGVIALLGFVGTVGGPSDPFARPRDLWTRAKLVASVFVAGSVVMVFLAVRRFSETGLALAIAVAYGLGTCAWSVGTESLRPHAPVVFLLAAGTWAYLASLEYPAYATLSGLAFGLAVACRPTAGLVVLSVGAHLLVMNRRAFAAYCLGGFPVAAALGAYNAYYFGSAVSFGRFAVDRQLAIEKTGSDALWQTSLWEGTAGLLLSPGRGVLTHSPFLIFAFAGIPIVWREARFSALRPIVVALAAMLAVAANWYDWWGGWCFGYRPLTDATPLLVLLLAPTLERVGRRRMTQFAFGVLLVLSIAVQALGAFAFDGEGWNVREVAFVLESPGHPKPVIVSGRKQAERLAAATPGSRLIPVRGDVDRRAFRSRLWSIVDNPIAYYLWNFRTSRANRLRMMADPHLLY